MEDNGPVSARPAGEAPIAVGKDRAAGYVCLARPAQRNAIDDAMRAAVAGALRDWIRDPEVYALLVTSAVPGIFSAGGDLRELTRLVADDHAGLRASFATEYRLNWALECFAKPTVSLINGLVVGSGVGLTLYGTHRVAGEDYQFSMPETAIGFFPDVGTVSVLAHLPHQIGVYLGLTGRRIGRSDALRLGLVTHSIPAARFAEITSGLADADPVDKLLDGLHVDPGEGPLAAIETAIEDAFSGGSVSEIVQRLGTLAQKSGPVAEWAGEVRSELAARSPTALAATLAHMRRVGSETLRETLQREYRLACRLAVSPDFREGVRAMVIDKDRAPHWLPASLADVTPDAIDALFAPLETGELELATREHMQDLRADQKR